MSSHAGAIHRGARAGVVVQENEIEKGMRACNHAAVRRFFQE